MASILKLTLRQRIAPAYAALVAWLAENSFDNQRPLPRWERLLRNAIGFCILAVFWTCLLLVLFAGMRGQS